LFIIDKVWVPLGFGSSFFDLKALQDNVQYKIAKEKCLVGAKDLLFFKALH